jgi:hypothetical protein
MSLKIELQDELESVVFEVKDKFAIEFIRSRQQAGKEFSIFFPEMEV